MLKWNSTVPEVLMWVPMHKLQNYSKKRWQRGCSRSLKPLGDKTGNASLLLVMNRSFQLFCTWTVFAAKNPNLKEEASTNNRKLPSPMLFSAILSLTIWILRQVQSLWSVIELVRAAVIKRKHFVTAFIKQQLLQLAFLVTNSRNLPGKTWDILTWERCL